MIQSGLGLAKVQFMPCVWFTLSQFCQADSIFGNLSPFAFEFLFQSKKGSKSLNTAQLVVDCVSVELWWNIGQVLENAGLTSHKKSMECILTSSNSQETVSNHRK